jgi:hypothetical protein
MMSLFILFLLTLANKARIVPNLFPDDRRELKKKSVSLSWIKDR